MTNRIRIAVAALAALVATLAATPAHAEDTRPCVSKAELYGLPHGDLTRADVEARWDVVHVSVGAGRGAFRFFIEYPFCGYDDASVTVSYRNGSRIWATTLLTKVQGSPPHGHEAHLR